MNFLNKISLLLLASVVFVSCERDYDAPPLSEPTYTGAEANITISELRTLGASATSDTPYIIAGEKILKAIVSGNDESGNIYKKVYIQDETGAIEMEVDQNSVYNYYPVGQTVYIDLEGLSISVYGSEQQLGHPDGYNYRIPWEDFEERVSKSGWANSANVTPIVISDISLVNTDVDGYKFKLVQFTGVTFENGGENTFAADDGYGEENIIDGNGNTLTVRTSNYADFGSNTLPKGKGNVTGILGRFNGSWQLTLRTADDVSGFTETTEDSGNNSSDDTTTTETVLFNETFGTPEKSGNYWPYFSEYTGFDNTDVTFEDESGKASVRITNNYTNVWLPTGSDITLAIKGIQAGNATNATLEYQVGANVYNSGESQDLSALKVRCNGVELEVPSKTVTGDNKEGNIPNKVVIENVTVSSSTTLEFYTTATLNVVGLRLYSVKLYTSGNGSSSDNSSSSGTTIEPIPTNN